MPFDEVPVACVDPSWLSDDFLPHVVEELTSTEFSVHLMPVDSHRESVFLCDRVSTALLGRCPTKELQLDPMDPTLGWESLVGIPDSSPVINTRTDCHVLIIKGGSFLPDWFVALHLDYLCDLAKCFQFHILLPVSRSVGEPIANRCKAFCIPSLKDVPARTVRELVQGLVTKIVPDLRDTASVDRSDSRDQMCDLILSEMPASRSEIEDILEYYSEMFDPERHKDVLEIANAIGPKAAGKRFREPSPIMSRVALASHFDITVERLNELGRQFKSDQGLYLLANTHDLLHPFISSDPMHWFIGCISFLSCLFFDAGKKGGLAAALEWDIDSSSGKLVRQEVHGFCQALRVLRTYFQHNLDPDSSDDRKTIAVVKKWFVDTLTVDVPFTRLCARQCLSALLDGLTNCLERLSRVLAALPATDDIHRRQFSLDLVKVSRTVAEHEIVNAIQKVIRDEGIDLDWEQVHKRYHPSIVKEMVNSTCAVGNRDELLLNVCRKYCYDLPRHPPNVIEIIRSAGLQNRQIGECNAELAMIWSSTPRMTPDEYRELARIKATKKMEELRISEAKGLSPT